MKIKEIAEKYSFDALELEAFIGRESEKLGIKTKGFFGDTVVDEDVEKAVEHFKKYKEERAKKQSAYEEKRKQKLLVEKQIEENRSSMMLSTCPSMEGYKVKKQLGLVFGECLFKAGFLKSLSASFENIGAVLSFGDKELSGTTTLLDNAREYAIRKMIDKAANLGANAIVGIDSESSAGGDIIHIAIMGTAVYLEPVEE